MAGKRLLDLAAIFNASRGVAQKHFALRARQADEYSRTSTLARAVKNQTDRITQTAKAASVLASRLNESAPAWASDNAEEEKGTSKTGGPIPSRSSSEGNPATGAKEGIEQDHHYDRSSFNTPLDPPPQGELEFRQEKADRYPLPDGTVPPTKPDERAAPIDDAYTPVWPQDKPHKEPLRRTGLKPASSGASAIPLPAKQPLPSKSARVAQRETEFQIPSETADGFDDSVALHKQGRDEDSFTKRSLHTSPELSSLPRVKIPKYPSATQEPEYVDNKGLNPDTFYNARQSAEAKLEEIPEGVNTAVFHSSRVAKALGGSVQTGRIGLETPRVPSVSTKGAEELDRSMPQEAKDEK